ncbi:MAG: hypothetical protein AAGG38_02185 [Planctomycetota bacterium]
MTLRDVGRLPSKFDPRLRRLWAVLTEVVPWVGDPSSAVVLEGGQIRLNLGVGEPFGQSDAGLTLTLDGDSLEVSGGGLRINNSHFVFNETPTGTIDGVNDSFGLAHPPEPGSLRVLRNGLEVRSGLTNDYTTTGTDLIFNAGAIPVTDDTLVVHYIQANT